MYAVVLFTFDVVELWVLTQNDKPCTRAKEVCKGQSIGKKLILSQKSSVAEKTRLKSNKSSCSLLWRTSWIGLRTREKMSINITEEEMHELLLSSYQPKATNVSNNIHNISFPQIRQQLKN